MGYFMVAWFSAIFGFSICAVLSADKFDESAQEKPPEENQGMWLINPDGYYPYCSKCGYEPDRPTHHKDNRTPYCSNCGAKMVKQRGDTE